MAQTARHARVPPHGSVRHVNRSTVKVFGYLFGQQAPLLATGLLPFWFIEGDAVMAETQMSSFGRGLQPSFTMHYRALGDEKARMEWLREAAVQSGDFAESDFYRAQALRALGRDEEAAKLLRAMEAHGREQCARTQLAFSTASRRRHPLLQRTRRF